MFLAARNFFSHRDLKLTHTRAPQLVKLETHHPGASALQEAEAALKEFRSAHSRTGAHFKGL